MAYYTMVTLLIAWGFLALFVLAGGVATWYALASLYDYVQEQIEPVVEGALRLVELVRPAYEATRERVRALAANHAIQQLRRS